MIEAVNTTNYVNYTAVNNNSDAAVRQEQQNSSVLDVQALLKKLGEYTYSESDIASVDEKLSDSLKKKFNISKEDIGKLNKNGYNLERLYMEDSDYYASFQSAQVYLNSSSTSYLRAEQIGDKVDVIRKQSDTMYLNSLYSKEPITINSLYQNNFKGSFKKANTSFTKEDMTKVLQMNGLDDTQGNRWAVSKLAEYGLDINQHDVTKLQNMKSAIDCLNKQEEIEKAREDIKNGIPIGERPLIKDDKMLYSTQDVKEIKDDLGKIDDDEIGLLVANGEEITINSLRATLFKNTDLALKRNKALSFTEGQLQKLQDIKDQMLQIRTKLTTEAAQKISEKMPLESSQLSKVAEELGVIENAAIQAAADEAGIELNEENAAIIRNVIQVRQEIIENKDQAIGIEAASDEKALLSEIHQALSKYMQNETPVESRFGENIKKVEAQIEKLLNNLGITEPSEEILQAAKALITNDMEVNEDNLNQILNITVKINTFIEEMTPNKTAVLIKEGLNPYHSSIDSLLEWMSQDKLEDLKGSVAETIVALSEKGAVMKEQKDALLGFYRIMQSVSKNREEVVGYLFKNNLPLTVEKLQEAVKYAGNSSNIEAVIDDNFGEIEDLKYTSQTAQMMMKEGQEQTAKSIDVVKMLEKMALPITEDSIEKLKRMNALLYPMIKEQFKKEMGKFEGMDSLPKSFLEKLEKIKQIDPKVVNHMLKEGIPPTVSNLYWIDKLLKEPDTYKELLKEGGMLQNDLPKSLDDFDKTLDQQEAEAGRYKEAALEKGNIVEYKTYKQIEEVVQLQKELSQKEGIYQIPFIIQGEEKMVHLYFNKKQNHNSAPDGDSTTAVMTYETEHLGIITTYMRFKEDSISYKIQGETKEITAKLQEDAKWLEDLLSGIGYAVASSEYQTRENENEKPVLLSPLKRGGSSFEEIV